jgi:glycosyltransferase involved in cell wall biosynthesis
VHFLIEALSMVKDEFPRTRLYILGDHIIDAYKDYREELTGLIERRGLREMVFFTGWRPDALAIVSLMDILVHPSLSEGFGRAVLEGMALGKAVIASRVGGLRELIEDDVNGLLVEPGNPSMIAAGLRRLLADRSFREDMGEEARRRVFSDYEITGRVRELEDIWSGMTLRK